MNYPVPVSVPVNYSNSSTFYPDASGVLGSYTKTPSGQTLITLDYTTLLGTLAGPPTITSVSFNLNYGTAPQLIVSGATVGGAGKVVTFMLSGGLNGLSYVLTVNAVLTSGSLSHQLNVIVSAPIDGDDCGCPPAGAGGYAVSNPVPIPNIYQQAQILNGAQTRFGSSFVVFWVADTAPGNANILDRWYNTQDGLIYDRATDGQTVFWVSTAQRPTQYTTSAVAPTSPQQGDFWYNTSNGSIQIYINTGTGLAWVLI